MRVLVYGAGAVGQAVGGLLAASAGNACQVTMLLRPGAADAIARAGLRIEGIFGEHHVAAGRMRLITDLAESHPAPFSRRTKGPRVPATTFEARRGPATETDPFDFVLVATKSYDTAAAAESLRRIDDGRFVVVSMQNGYGNVERLTAAFGPDRVLCARVITGFVIPQPGTVRITVHADAVTIGRFDGADSPAADRLAGALAAAGLPARASRQVQSELWAKILYNCALNPLGAILGVTYGRLADRPETRAIMDQILDEAYAVLAAHSVPLLHPSAEQFRQAFYGRMVPPTAAHTPSMLQDLRAGKRTEIDALNDALVALGEQVGLETPVNRTLSGMVKFLESPAAAPAGPASQP